jgi:D-alanyl-D-alanine carboxypeptidase
MAKNGLAESLCRNKFLGVALLVGATLLTAYTTFAEARGWRHHHAYSVHARHRFVLHGVHGRVRHAHFRHRSWRHYASGGHSSGGMTTPAGIAAIVVDGNSGRMMFGANEHQQRHPASVTKVMTLYLLFEQLEKGRLRLNSPLTVSQHAAAQAPSKLGLEPGETIEVEDAIKAVVTKSANDIAVAIAENIAGDEATFAEMMTSKAHALGMRRTHFANASGLPDSTQLTTAYDLAVLGRAIQDRFPRYYRYFSTHAFAYGGQVHRNHNHLLGRVEGMDGIKTGYTAASGFNLLTSVRRDGHHIVAVVLGGRTAGARDRYMADLIEEHIDSGESRRTAQAITEDDAETADASSPWPFAPAQQQVAARVEEKEEAPAPAATAPKAVRAEVAEEEPAARSERIRPAFVTGGRKAEAPAPTKRAARDEERQKPVAVGGSTSAASGKNASRTVVAATTTPSALKRADKAGDSARPSRPGWMIQLGATDDAEKAQALLARARSQGHGVLASATAFTEKVQKGHETLYRARFAGLEEQSAESACRTLKRSGFSCFATKN